MNIICKKALFIGWVGIVLESENNFTFLQPLPIVLLYCFNKLPYTSWLKKTTTEICYHIILEI